MEEVEGLGTLEWQRDPYDRLCRVKGLDSTGPVEEGPLCPVRTMRNGIRQIELVVSLARGPIGEPHREHLTWERGSLQEAVFLQDGDSAKARPAEGRDSLIPAPLRHALLRLSQETGAAVYALYVYEEGEIWISVEGWDVMSQSAVQLRSLAERLRRWAAEHDLEAALEC